MSKKTNKQSDILLNPTLSEFPASKNNSGSDLSILYRNIAWTIKLNLKLLPRPVIFKTVFSIYTSLEPLIHGFIWGIFIDTLIEKDLDKIWSIFFIYLGILALSFFLEIVNKRVDIYAKMYSKYKYQIYFSEKIAGLGVPNLEIPEIANKIHRVNESYTDIWGLTVKLSNAISFLVAVVISLTVVTKISIPLVALVTMLVVIRGYIHGKELKEDWKFTTKNTENNRISNSYIGTITEVKTLKEVLLTNSYELFMKRFEKFNDWYFSVIAKMRMKKGLIDGIFELGFLAIVGYMIYSFILQYLDDQLTIGMITFYIASFRTYIFSSKNFLGYFVAVSESKDRVNDAYEISTMESTDESRTQKITKDNDLFIKLDKVNFTYPTGTYEVLKDIDLSIKRGEKVAIVGENGAGKTTLINLILGLYPVSSGKVTIGGIDINEIHLDSWFEEVGMLLQSFNTYEFMSLEDNLALGRVDGNRLDEVTKIAGIDEMKEKYKYDWKQILGAKFTNGVTPSVGQWQKIAIARTLHRDTPIIIMDEPTSSLDPIAEAQIFNQLFEKLADKTVIIISHRFSTVKKADRILVMDKGQSVEEGSHSELMRQDGLYAKSFNVQAEAYREVGEEGFQVK